MNKYSSAWTMTNLIILFTNHGVALILLIVYDMGVHSLFYAELISYLVYTIISIYILSSYFRFSFTPRAIDDIIHIGLFAVPQNLFGLIQRNISKYMLQIFMPVNALGLYTRSEIIHIGFKSFSKSFNNAVSPKYIENKKKNGEDSSIHHTMIYWLFFLSTIQLFFILFLMDIFKLVKVNEAFWDCAIYAPILGMVIIISSYNLPYNNNILVSKKTYLYTIRAIIGGILMIILAYYLIPKIGIIGAIIPILVSSFIHMFTEYFFSEHYLNNKTVINLRIYFLVLIFLFIVITLPFLGFTFTLISKCFIFSTYLLFLAVYEKRYLYGKVFHSINSFSV